MPTCSTCPTCAVGSCVFSACDSEIECDKEREFSRPAQFCAQCAPKGALSSLLDILPFLVIQLAGVPGRCACRCQDGSERTANDSLRTRRWLAARSVLTFNKLLKHLNAGADLFRTLPRRAPAAVLSAPGLPQSQMRQKPVIHWRRRQAGSTYQKHETGYLL